MDKLNFDGRVAVVTGAGRGIGRAYAQLLAARGAQVVVNDTGVSMDGTLRETGSVAEDVATAIADGGGVARADTSDVATEGGARSLIDRAIADFGRLDIVVNNAGIYSLDSFPEVELETMRRFYDVHVGGSFNVTRAAWPHLVASGSGRVVMTISTAALGGQNMIAYGTAKGAVLALGRSLAHAGEPHGIKVNMVAPMGMTRMAVAGAGMTGDVPHDPALSPDLVAPLVAILCHEGCPTTGETYVSGMRRGSRLFMAETHGYTHSSLDLAPEDVAHHWPEIADAGDYAEQAGVLEQAMYMSQLVEAATIRANE